MLSVALDNEDLSIIIPVGSCDARLAIQEEDLELTARCASVINESMAKITCTG